MSSSPIAPPTEGLGYWRGSVAAAHLPASVWALLSLLFKSPSQESLPRLGEGFLPTTLTPPQNARYTLLRVFFLLPLPTTCYNGNELSPFATLAVPLAP